MRTRNLYAAAAATAVLLLGPLAGTASAHVSVSAPDATQGGYTKLTFRVPTEKDVPTTQIELAMPTDTPIASVRVKPKEGWSYTVTKAAPSVVMADDDGSVSEIVSRIIWTAAAGGGIKPGEFDEFEVSAGPLPETDQVVFKVLQTYSDGSLASWIEEPVEGGEEPEMPAPVLALAAAVSAGSEHGMAGPAVTEEAASAPTDTTATVLAAAALGVGVLALIAVGFFILRTRRTHG